MSFDIAIPLLEIFSTDKLAHMQSYIHSRLYAAALFFSKNLVSTQTPTNMRLVKLIMVYLCNGIKKLEQPLYVSIWIEF